MSLTACGALFFDDSRAISNYAQSQIEFDHNKGFFASLFGAKGFLWSPKWRWRHYVWSYDIISTFEFRYRLISNAICTMKKIIGFLFLASELQYLEVYQGSNYIGAPWCKLLWLYRYFFTSFDVILSYGPFWTRFGLRRRGAI